MVNPVWALADLVVSTPRLSLRYISDDLGLELAELAAHGVHDPATMPFSTPWTDVKPPCLQRNTLRYFWLNRAETTVQHWDLNLAVIVDGNVVGVSSLAADEFPSKRSVETGSWVGLRYQGQGIGTEVRMAALHLVFAGFDADRATTRAWQDNTASLRITRALNYTEDGCTQQQRRDCCDTMLEFSINRRRWHALGRNDISLTGIEGVREQLETKRKG